MNTNKAWGGGEKWHFKMALALQNKGYQVTIITNRESELKKKCQEFRVPHYSITTTNLSFLNPFKILNLIKFIKSIQPNTIILNLPIDVKLGGLAAKLAGMSNIIYRRGMPHPLKNSFLNRYYFTNVLTRIIANSNEVKRSLLEGNTWLNEKKISVIYNGVFVPESKPQRKVRTTPFIIGNLGRLVEQKGQEDLLILARNLKEKTTLPFKIIIGGDGPLKSKLQHEINVQQLENEIELKGHVDNVEHFMKEIDLLVFPSRFEGSSNVLIETLANIVPIVAYDIEPNKEVIRSDVSGILVPLLDTTKLSEACLKIMTDEKISMNFADQGWNILNQQFDEKLAIEKLEKII